MTEHKKRHIAILGSTGSIGTQAVEVVKAYPDQFQVEVLTTNNNSELLIQQAVDLKPNVVVICNEDRYDQVFSALDPLGIKVYAGAKSIASVVQMDTIDMVLTAMVGYAGLLPTIKAIEAGKSIALANKETLVVAGEIITRLAAQKGVNIYPVDSEHSAIFQCLVGEFHNPIEKIILTASGGPFRGRSREFLANVTKAQALKHPNWTMGAKITIDSATLMNKGLEVIEAKWLFGLRPGQIDVVVHPQSIIHSLVQFEDGSLKAQMGLPDMRLPIQFALGYPNRLKSDLPRFNFMDYPSLTFEQPDLDTFRNLQLAFDALEKGGNAPCIINAANEVAVDAFLHDRITFLEISEIIEACLSKTAFVQHPTYDDYVRTDEAARQLATERIKSFV
ncbi:1-deoxy-D-xylulose-5-phosphate reductoisomerase [Spirosoma sp. BT702]|uniref:1-deoxy-D-xylulose 5-phosphate reductoisomerase n=1 Tax=Spirosoma profusum TaxID=2771354 RepID=A0A926XUZ0_9BACT|nr:1-deoxy-D-xylulose-5-phosphate reductoisomerase [Spirosoma profusum]MBD2701029.1 1-deoxy-D-xylulose-5-phosphate reductoisomerase [Spirosoma profusum]